jgi:hypothetical protein
MLLSSVGVEGAGDRSSGAQAGGVTATAGSTASERGRTASGGEDRRGGAFHKLLALDEKHPEGALANSETKTGSETAASSSPLDPNHLAALMLVQAPSVTDDDAEPESLSSEGTEPSTPRSGSLPATGADAAAVEPSPQPGTQTAGTSALAPNPWIGSAVQASLGAPTSAPAKGGNPTRALAARSISTKAFLALATPFQAPSEVQAPSQLLLGQASATARWIGPGGGGGSPKASGAAGTSSDAAPRWTKSATLADFADSTAPSELPSDADPDSGDVDNLLPEPTLSASSAIEAKASDELSANAPLSPAALPDSKEMAPTEVRVTEALALPHAAATGSRPDPPGPEVSRTAGDARIEARSSATRVESTSPTKEAAPPSLGESSREGDGSSPQPERSLPDAPTSGSSSGRIDVPSAARLDRNTRVSDPLKAQGGGATADRAAVAGQDDATSAGGSGSATVADASLVRALPAADATGVNALTPAKELPAQAHVTEASTAPIDPTSVASAVNQQVIRSAAHGIIELPELGRIQVTARSEDGGIDVRVTPDRAETATILLPHAEAMASEVRGSGNSNVRVDVEGHGAAFSSHTGGSGGGGHDAGGRRPSESSSLEEGKEGHPGPARQRVRIVL